MKFTNRAQALKDAKISYLGSVMASGKVVKNQKVNKQMTYLIYLAPAGISGYNTCPYSTPECRMGCLYSSGRAKIEDFIGKDMIKRARIKKTILFYEHQDFFMELMINEMAAKKKIAESKGYNFSARLNGTSDIEWENVLFNGKNIFDTFPDVTFYDYTKNHKRFDKNLPLNYHLTYSHTGRNTQICKKLLQRGVNVAVVFSDKNFPETWNGFKVINGDKTDFRPADGNGVVVGLGYKILANKESNKKVLNSCFVIKTNVNVRELEVAF